MKAIELTGFFRLMACYKIAISDVLCTSYSFYYFLTASNLRPTMTDSFCCICIRIYLFYPDFFPTKGRLMPERSKQAK